MTEQSSPPDDIRSGYNVAAQLAAQEAHLAWRVTGIFVQFAIVLIGGAVLPSFIGVTDPKVIALVATAFSAAGIAATLMWWSMAARSKKFHSYWFASARELEKHLTGIQTIARGKQVAEGNAAEVDGTPIVCRKLERVRIGTNLHLFYAIFLAIFLGLLIWNFLRVVAAF